MRLLYQSTLFIAFLLLSCRKLTLSSISRLRKRIRKHRSTISLRGIWPRHSLTYHTSQHNLIRYNRMVQDDRLDQVTSALQSPFGFQFRDSIVKNFVESWALSAGEYHTRICIPYGDNTMVNLNYWVAFAPDGPDHPSQYVVSSGTQAQVHNAI